jgi:two-component system sensor histidine kinase MprB
VAADGEVLYSTGQVAGAPPTIDPDIIDEALASGGLTTTIAPVPGVDLRVFIQPFRRPDLDLTGVLVAGQSAGLTAANLRGLSAVLVVAGIVTILAAWLVSRLVAARALQPLGRLAETADRISKTGDLDARLPPSQSQDEVHALTTSFNGMLDRLRDSQRQLADSLERQQQFVADASHELRSPLAVVRSNLSFLLRESPPTIDRDIAEDRMAAISDAVKAATAMTALIDDLLALARLDAGQRNPIEVVSIAEVVKRAVERSGGGLDLEVGALPPVEVRGDPEGLTRLLVNLIANARSHGRPPIEIEATQVDGSVTVEVRDRGPGIPPGSEEQIFDRFHQLDPARSGEGTGLGLAIARGLAEQHGGTVTAGNRRGGGAVFSLRLPES